MSKLSPRAPRRSRPSRPSPTPRPSRGLPTPIWGRASWVAGRLGALALLAASIALIRWLLTGPEFQLTTVLVAGNDLAPADQIAAALPLQGTNLFLVRGLQLAKIVEKNPTVAQAWIRPHLPNLLVIDIEERQPAVVWDQGEAQWLVDGDGRVLAPGARPLATISASPEAALGPGQQVDAGAVHMARAVTARLAELGLAASKLEYDPARGMAIIVDGAYRVELGFGDQLDARLEAFETIRRYLQQSHTPVQLIDVRFLERPYFR